MKREVHSSQYWLNDLKKKKRKKLNRIMIMAIGGRRSLWMMTLYDSKSFLRQNRHFSVKEGEGSKKRNEILFFFFFWSGAALSDKNVLNQSYSNIQHWLRMKSSIIHQAIALRKMMAHINHNMEVVWIYSFNANDLLAFNRFHHICE